MVKDYTVLDGMINNQSTVLKAAYDRGYAHGVTDGKDSMASVSVKHAREEYDRGYTEGWSAGSDAIMKFVVSKFVEIPSDVEIMTDDTKQILKDASNYIDRLLNSGLGKQKSLEYLKKFIETENNKEEEVQN